MNITKEMIELDTDFDFSALDPQELLKNLGIADLTIDELLGHLQLGYQKVSAAFREGLYSKGCQGMRAYHHIGKQYAPVALALFNHLMARGSQPRIPTYLAVNRYQSSLASPSAAAFWDDPDAIAGLYESLKQDGYYDGTHSASSST